MSEEILLHRDLIGRLRDYVNIIDDYDLAADAIENLEEILREQIKEKMQFFWQKVEQDKEISRLRAENEKLRATFRVNMLRAFPSMSHDEIDAEIEAAIREGGNN
jgi:hypothetical protein